MPPVPSSAVPAPRVPPKPDCFPKEILGTEATIERQRFYALLWGAQPGWVEVCAGLNGAELQARGWLRPGEPNSADHIGLLTWTRQSYDADCASRRPHTRRLFQWPNEADKLDGYAVLLAQKFGNVYVGLSTYPSADDAKRRRDPQPSRVVLVEDGPPDPALPYSFEVLTSPYSRHGYYLLKTPCSPQQLVALATGAASRLSGADPSGSDRQQLVRVPTSVNSKQKAGNFRVRLIDHQRSYQAIELAAHFAPDVARLSAPGASAALADSDAWALVATLSQPENLRPGGPLLTEDGALRRLKTAHFINRVLVGESLWTERPAGCAATYSEWRFNLIKALWLHGYPQVEVRLLTESLAADDLDKRGTVQLRVDIDRIIGKLSVSHPRDERTCTASYRLITGQAAARQPTPRAQRGRPSTKPAQMDRLRVWLSDQTPNDWGLILASVQDIAAALHLGSRSTQGYLCALREAGEIATGQIDGNGPAFIILTNRFRGAEKSASTGVDAHRRCDCVPSPHAHELVGGGAETDNAQSIAPPSEATTLPLPVTADRDAEKTLPAPPESAVSGGAVEDDFSAAESAETALPALMERTPPPCAAAAASGGEAGGVCAPVAAPVADTSPRTKRRSRQRQARPTFGTPLPEPKRRPRGLPHKTRVSADVPSLEAELHRRRAMLPHLKRGPARSAVERAIFELERLISSRRDLSLVRMVSANVPDPQPPGEPAVVRVGEAIAFAGGAVFAPPGSVSEAILCELVAPSPAAPSGGEEVPTVELCRSAHLFQEQ